MKRHGNLWPQVTAFENLLHAARQAQRGKRFRPSVLDFNYHLEAELSRLQTELRQHTYQPGAYQTFHIFEPKPRLISAAPYRDRVVHHALCNVIVPLLDRGLIADTYANRTGLGTHRALRRFTQFARSSRYVLLCDIRKYFPSIDHEILKGLIRRKIRCAETLGLIDQIIDNSNEQESSITSLPGDPLLTPCDRRRGLPIGNLTSQFFSNLYLNPFDYFVKETLRVGKYLRYVDDFALFSDDRSFLSECRGAIETNLATLRLEIHPIKSQLFETRIGANFVGFRVLPDRIRVRNHNLQRSRRRLHQLQAAHATGAIELQHVERSLQSWMAHLAHADSWRLRQQVLAQIKGKAIDPSLNPLI